MAHPSPSPFAGSSITTARLILTPLQPEDADQLVEVLADERLHEFVGGRPATLDELRNRYRRMVAGSPEPGEVWLNWVVRLRGGQAVGTVQATVTSHVDQTSAQVAWVIGVDWQGRGYASEAAQSLVDWLRQQGAASVSANIHPDHGASEVVATRAGFRRTADLVDGERVWRLPA